MNVPRKRITDAVFAVLNSVVLPTSLGGAGWKKSTKDVDIFTNVNAFDQPYMGLICPDESASDPQAFGLTKWIRKYYACIYIRTDALPLQEGTYIQDTIDDVLDAVDLAFSSPRKGEQNTLGGIVQDCTIDGTIQVDPGTLDQQIAIIIPISIITGI
jgi:hypothetical protein